MGKFLIGAISHYYWFLVVIAASLMFGFRDTSSGLIVITVLAFLFCFNKIQFNFLDGIVIIYVFYCLMTGLLNAYPFRLFYLGFRAEIIPICFYFFARSEEFQNDDFFFNIRKPLLFAMACGILFYFTMPSFYLSYKSSVLWNSMNIDTISASGHLLYEISRLSSFWPHSYFIGYSSLFLLVLCSKKIIVDGISSHLDVACLLVSFFCLFFAQQRVSIAFAVLYLIVLTIYASINKLENRRILYLLWMTSIVLGIAMGIISVIILGPDFVEYVLNRSVNYDGNMVGDRFKLFEDFFNHLSLFGKGLGRYGHGAFAEGFPTIPDCDYVRVPAELGFLGLALLMFICLNSLQKGIALFKYCLFEVVCILFALVSMLGAATWELGTLQPFMYWFCLGHIQSKFNRQDELEEEYAEYIRLQTQGEWEEDDEEESLQ